MSPLHKAFFTLALGYAVAGGIWDYLTGRPDLHRRLAMVMMARQIRAMTPVFSDVSHVVSHTTHDFHRLALGWREYERWIGQYEREGQ